MPSGDAEIRDTPAKSSVARTDAATPEAVAPSDTPPRPLASESTSVAVPRQDSGVMSPATLESSHKSFAGTLTIAPLEARISAEHLKELQANARLMEGGQDHDGEKKWFEAAVEVQTVEESGVKCIAFQPGGYVAVRLGGHVYRLDMATTVTELIIAAVVLLVMYLVLGAAMKPGGSVFAPIMTIIFGTLLGTLIAKVLGTPPLVGMLIAGMIWGNLPGGLAKGISDSLYKFLRNFAVAVILSRAGLTFKWKLTKPVVTNVAVLSMLPQLCEVFAHAAVAFYLFPGVFPTFAFALYQGSAIAASSTAVVIPGVSAMQERGFSVTRGPGILMLCSVAFDAVFAVWLTSFIFELVFPDEASNMTVGMKLAFAPVQIVGGAIVGVILGIISHFFYSYFFDRIDKASEVARESVAKASRMKALILSTALNVGSIFFFYKIGYPGAGTVAVMCASGTVAFMWGRNDGAQDNRRQLLYKDTATLWDSYVMPCLFSIVGSTIDLGILTDMNMLPSIVTCIGLGLICKMIGCVIVCTGAGYSLSEKLFLAFGWCAKSTVQAATAGKIIVQVGELRRSGWADGDADRTAFLDGAAAAGALTNTIVITSILFCAIGAGVAMKVLGPRFLVKEEGVVAGGH